MLVTRQVVSFVRRRLDTGQPAGVVPLDLPPRTLRTRAVWWTISPGQRAGLAGAGVDLPGAAHAAEHASIGLLPLVAACDRWDVGGVSADLHPATGRLTVFVYDGHDGGAGFAERGFRAARDWLGATAQAIASCECAAGCPSCIQSPKCGNGNEPLSKHGSGPAAGVPARRRGGGRASCRRICKRLHAIASRTAWLAAEKRRPPPGGERGSPCGPAPGGQSRCRHP